MNGLVHTVKEMVDSRIRKLRNQRQKTRKRQILKTAACIKHLEELHENYVLVPADKAGNNVIVVCKQYYKEVLTQEPLHIYMYMYVVVSQQRW